MEHPVAPSRPQLYQDENPPVRAISEYSNEHAQRGVEVEKYLAAAVSSISRVRGVVLVLITASVLSFTAYWRSTGTWLDKKIAARHAALAAIDEINSLQGSFEPEWILRGQRYLQIRGLDPRNESHKALLLEEVKEYGRMRMERDTVRVPFFGIDVESNDVTLFSGLAFVIGLLWLRLSLLRELRNLRLVFKRASEGRMMRLCYELLAMQQVLSNPPVYGQDNPRAWNLIAKSLFLIPLIVYVPLVWTDYKTLDIGMMLNANVGAMFLWSSIFMVSIFILTWLCMTDSFKIDRVWEEAATGVGWQELE